VDRELVRLRAGARRLSRLVRGDVIRPQRGDLQVRRGRRCRALEGCRDFKYAANRQFADELSHLLGDTISEVDERIVRRAARIAAAELAWAKRLGTVLLSKSDAAIALDTAEKGVASLVRGGKLIALVHNGEPRFPAWQFAHDFDVDARAALAQAHQIYVATAGVSPWSAASWLIAEHPELNGESPVRWITLGEDREQLRRVAERDAARATR
jgi:hypothetical protein